MAPRNSDTGDIANIDDADNEFASEEVPLTFNSPPQKPPGPPQQIVWRNVIWFSWLHLAALYGLYCVPFASPWTWLWASCLYLAGGLGITAGAHRLWAHRSYKAKMPLRLLLTVFNTIAFQNDVIEWSRDHRVHHRFSEQDADPHNAKRGFFFAHIGWLLVRKHPEVKAKGKDFDLSDLYSDPILRFQRKHYVPLVLLACFVVPTLVPYYYWGESLVNSFYVATILRYTILLNFTWSVNSFAHLFGNQPYDKHINPAENILVTVGAIGEGFHNYHHSFPSDYSTSEYGMSLNPTTVFIDAMAAIGLAYGRKKMSREAVSRRKQRTGDGTSGFGYFEKSNKME